MVTLYSLLFWSYLGLSSALLFVLALVVRVVTLPFDPRGRLLHLYTCLWASHYTYLNPLWTVRVEGRKNGLAARPCVYVANHQSAADVVVLFRTYLPFKWLSKASMFRAPFIGWNMWLNRYVSLVRGDKDSIGRAQELAGRWIARGVPMMYFPEGTRSKDGEIQPFKHGAFSLALSQGVPVVPIVLEGTRDCMPKHSWRLDQRADVLIRVLPAVPIDGFRGKDPSELGEHVRGIMKGELARLRSERGQR